MIAWENQCTPWDSACLLCPPLSLSACAILDKLPEIFVPTYVKTKRYFCSECTQLLHFYLLHALPKEILVSPILKNQHKSTRSKYSIVVKSRGCGHCLWMSSLPFSPATSLYSLNSAAVTRTKDPVSLILFSFLAVSSPCQHLTVEFCSVFIFF